MVSHSLGFIEMGLVFSLCVGFGIFELWSLRRMGKTAPPPVHQDAAAAPAKNENMPDEPSGAGNAC